ncbi:MAG: hypothetical protein GY828_00875, partial [Candidatus Gracilibacteria bacterium]|nr:hypothetical protein [Candidatus Gracilibacteria bacterium]
ESEGLTTYNAVVEFSGEKELEIIAKKVSENNVITLEGNIDIVSENVNISFDTKVTEKEPTKTYTIPTNVQDIEVTFAEIMTLPSFHQVGYFSKPEVLIVTVTAGSVLGTVAYISLTGYAQDAKNTKAYNDVRSLRSAVERSILMGDVTYKDLVISRTETQEINIRVGGKKVIEGENYFVGAINFNALGQENYGFGDDYQIAVYMQGAKAYYQILGFTTDGHGNKMPLINGNYYAQEVERFDFTTISSSEDESVIEVSGYTNFAEGDVTNLGEITKITGDKITLSGNLEGGITKIYLLGNDSASLFEEDGIILINGY